MLLSLSIRNFVLIDAIDLDFAGGLTVLTGETGAGKSILLDALGLVLGNRAEKRFFGSSADTSQVVAEFDIANIDGLSDYLDENDIPAADGNMIVRRSLKPDGKSKAFINDVPVSTSMLQEIANMLIEVHGQHDQRSLLNKNAHRQLLDSYSGLDNELESLERKFNEWKSAQNDFESAKNNLDKAKKDQDYLEHVLKELEAIDPLSGEEEELVSKRKLLQNHEKIVETINSALSSLEDVSVSNSLKSASRILERASAETNIFEKVISSLDTAALEAEESIDSLRAIAESDDFNVSNLEEIEDRLFALRDLARKHRVDVESLPGLLNEFREKIQLIETSDEKIAELKNDLNKKYNSFLELATSISDKRKKSAKKFEKLMSSELSPLKMEGCSVKVDIQDKAEDKWNSYGLDSISFLVKTNPGSPYGPLSKIASGGELSRFMLALKVVMSDVRSTPTIIFDEIDTGIGGATSDAVGKRLNLLSKKFQVLTVTHQPQIAAYGDSHMRVEKESAKNKTSTRVVSLTGQAKKEEVARMLAGSVVTQEARAAAGKLMEAEQ